ncbi:MAG: hypothetical protein R2748_29750, partial [Bryobacterales bacterium]
TMTIDADVPFPFVVGDTSFGPGQYVLRSFADGGAIEVRSENGTAAVLQAVESASVNKAPETSELIFKRYGDREFLSQVFMGGERIGVQLVQSKLEKELLGKGQKPIVHAHPARSFGAGRDRNSS